MKRSIHFIILFGSFLLFSFNVTSDNELNNNKSKDQRYMEMICSKEKNRILEPYKVKNTGYLIENKSFIVPKVDKAIEFITDEVFQQKINEIVNDTIFLKLKKEIVGTDKQEGNIIDECISKKTIELDKYVSLYGNISELQNILHSFIKEDEDLIEISGYCVNKDFKELYFVDAGFLYRNAIEVKSCNLYNPMSYTVLWREYNEQNYFKTFNYVILDKMGYFESKYCFSICLPIVYNEEYIADVLFTYLK